MVNAKTVQSTVSAVLVRADLKRTIEINKYTKGLNDYKEETLTFLEQTTSDGIVLEYVQHANKYDKAGLFKDSSFIVLFPFDTILDEVTIEYILVIGSKEYEIQRVSKSTLGEEYIHQKVFVKERLQQ